MSRPLVRTLFRNLILIACYAAMGVLCFRIAAAAEGFAAAIWIPEGFAVAAVLLYGRGMLPGVWIGAFIPNFFVGSAPAWHDISLSAIIATGHLVGILFVHELLPRFKSASFLHLDQVMKFLRATIVGALVSAAIGATAVTLTHPLPYIKGSVGWVTWWIGNALGILVLAPMLITVLSEQPMQKKIN